MANGNNSNGAPKPVRCAIYTRKLSEHWPESLRPRIPFLVVQA